jgi:hypothetical protein
VTDQRAVLALMMTSAESTGIDVLEQLLNQRPAWHADAACREHPEIKWFPERGADLAAIRAVCACCLVQAECYQSAIDHDERDGWWAGMSAKRLHQVRHAAA